MVDADVEVPGIVGKGKLRMLSTGKALLHKVCLADSQVGSFGNRSG